MISILIMFYWTLIYLLTMEDVVVGRPSPHPFPLAPQFLPKQQRRLWRKKGHVPKILLTTNMWQKKEKTCVENKWEDYICKRWVWWRHPREMVAMEPRWWHCYINAQGKLRSLKYLTKNLLFCGLPNYMCSV